MMRIEMISEEDIDVYINPYNFECKTHLEKEDIIDLIKELIIKINIRYHLNLKGFYKIKAYFNEKAGLFLNVVKIDDNEFSNEVDFRIIMFKNEKFLFETEYYEFLNNFTNKKYYKNKFYIDLEDIDDLTSIIDMGRIIYGEEAKEILIKAKKIK